MTSYTAIANSEVDSDSPVTDTLVTRLRDNPLAIAEGASGAPFLSSGWHNYDGAQALTAIYDFSVHGSVATIVSPNFADGWEYQFIFDGLTNASGGSTEDFNVELYRETSAAYATALRLFTDVSTQTWGMMTVEEPRASRNFHRVTSLMDEGAYGNATGGTAAKLTNNDFIIHTTAQKILKARFSHIASNTNGGKIYMARRQVGYTR
ncbi:MAG: hypothetical protein EBT13_13790 [Rhodobacteraceae bacterium]|nr:hypothetical protein [Paracoccaceae bacterium]